MVNSIQNIMILLGAYLLGSLPFSVIIGKVFFNVDVRKAGSGNPGATNTLRLLGPKAGLSVLLLDIGKGVGCVFLGNLLIGNGSLTHHELQVFPGALSIIGHIYSPFLGFKGGKGVATSTGVIFALQPIIGLIILLSFSGILAATRYVSLGSVLCAISYPILSRFLPESWSGEPASVVFMVFSLALALLVTVKHRSNIQRLMNGTENKFGQKKPAA